MDKWTVVKQEYGMECDHPACAILHNHLSTEPFADGQGHWVDVYHNYKDSKVWMTRWHEKQIVEWVILLNGERHPDSDTYDTKREATQHMQFLQERGL